MGRKQPMTERERMRRREQMRRKKKRRLRRKIRRICRFILTVLFLAAVVWLLLFALKKMNILPDHKKYDLEKPVQRTEEEVRKKLEEMSKKHKGYKDILEHYEDYPEAWLAALANNPEMLDYVKGYPDHQGVSDAVITKTEKKRITRCSFSGTAAGVMHPMVRAVSGSPDAARPVCRW